MKIELFSLVVISFLFIQVQSSNDTRNTYSLNFDYSKFSCEEEGVSICGSQKFLSFKDGVECSGSEFSGNGLKFFQDPITSGKALSAITFSMIGSFCNGSVINFKINKQIVAILDENHKSTKASCGSSQEGESCPTPLIVSANLSEQFIEDKYVYEGLNVFEMEVISGSVKILNIDVTISTNNGQLLQSRAVCPLLKSPTTPCYKDKKDGLRCEQFANLFDVYDSSTDTINVIPTRCSGLDMGYCTFIPKPTKYYFKDKNGVCFRTDSPCEGIPSNMPCVGLYYVTIDRPKCRTNVEVLLTPNSKILSKGVTCRPPIGELTDAFTFSEFEGDTPASSKLNLGTKFSLKNPVQVIKLGKLCGCTGEFVKGEFISLYRASGSILLAEYEFKSSVSCTPNQMYYYNVNPVDLFADKEYVVSQYTQPTSSLTFANKVENNENIKSRVTVWTDFGPGPAFLGGPKRMPTLIDESSTYPITIQWTEL